MIRKYKKTRKKYDLLIVFGGSDRKNLAYKYFKYLKNLNLEKIFIFNKKLFNKFKNLKTIKKTKIQKYSSKVEFIKISSIKKHFTPSNIMFEAFSLNVKGNVIPIEKTTRNGKVFSKKGLVKFTFTNLCPQKINRSYRF